MDYSILIGLNIFIHNSIYIVIYRYTFYRIQSSNDLYESVSLLIIPICKEYSIRMKIIESVHEISKNVVCATSKASDQPANTRSLIRAFASRLGIL